MASVLGKLRIIAVAAIVVCAFSLGLATCGKYAFADEGGSSVAVADDPAVGQDAPDYAQKAESGDSSKDSAKEDEDDNDADNRLDPTQRADNSFIYDTTIESLFEQASLYEGNTVQVVGEVVGDLISAGDQGEIGRELYWVMLTSTDVENKSSISVLITAEQSKQIDHYGRYGVTGTILQVRGTYHQACADHQGLPDIHAANASAMVRGIEHPDSFNADHFFPGIVAVVIGLILMGVYYFARERSR